jgi:hypothetical protein
MDRHEQNNISFSSMVDKQSKNLALGISILLVFIFIAFSFYAIMKMVDASTSTTFGAILMPTIICYFVDSIVRMLQRIYKLIATILYYIFWWISYFIDRLWIPIIMLIIASIPFLIIYFVARGVWDAVFRPILSAVSVGINIVVKIWNIVVKAVRIFGIRLPGANEMGSDAPTFWQIMKWIIFTLILTPLEIALKGTIIR